MKTYKLIAVLPSFWYPTSDEALPPKVETAEPSRPPFD